MTFGVRTFTVLFIKRLFWPLSRILFQYFCQRNKIVELLNLSNNFILDPGEGSLISYLRKKVWALSLSGGNDGDGTEFNVTCSLFTITIVLTKAGHENIREVNEENICSVLCSGCPKSGHKQVWFSDNFNCLKTGC